MNASNCNCSYHRRPASTLSWLATERKQITLIGGFLGAGKTTLLNHLLANASSDSITDVVIREFGDISVDDQLIVNGGYSHIHTYFGFTLHDDPLLLFYDYLLKIFEESLSYSGTKAFDQLILENSGAEDPEKMMLLFFDEDFREAYKLGSYIGVVDAQFGELNFKQFRVARKQIAMADIVLINKADLVDQSTLQSLTECIHRLNPIAKPIVCSYSNVPPDKVMNVDWYEQMKHIGSDNIIEETGMEEIKTVSISESRPMDKEKINRWIETLFNEYGASLLRSKGFFNFADEDYRYEFQGVRSNFNSKADRKWNEHDERKSVVVLIGEDLPSINELRKAFSECISD